MSAEQTLTLRQQIDALIAYARGAGLDDAANYVERYVLGDPFARAGIWLRDRVVAVLPHTPSNDRSNP